MGVFLAIWLISLLAFFLSLRFRAFGNLLTKLIIIVAFSLAGLRGRIYPDYIEYEAIYKGLYQSNFWDPSFVEIHGEIGFKVILKLIGYISHSPVVMFLGVSILSAALLVLICKRHNLNLSIVWLVYFSSSFLLKDLGQIRNSVASLFFVLAILERSQLKSIFLLIWASVCFQYFVFIGFFARFFRKKIFIPTALMCGALAYLFLNFDILVREFGQTGFLAQYSGTPYIETDLYSSFLAAVRSGALFFCVRYLLPRHRRSEDQRVLLCAVALSVISYIGLSNIPILAQRVGGYFISADAFLLASAQRDNPGRRILVIIILYSALIFSFNISNRYFLSIPYESIFRN